MHSIKKSIRVGMALCDVKSYAVICEQAEIRPSTISDLIAERSSPNYATLVKLAEFFDVKLSKFIEWGEIDE